MSFINNLQATWNQPWGAAIEDFKDLSKTQKAAVIFFTGIVAFLPPLAILAFRSLVGRCTERNDAKNEQQIAMVIIGEKDKTFEWIKNQYESSKATKKDKESITHEIEQFEFLYNFVKKNPLYIEKSNITNIIRRINLNCQELGYNLFEDFTK